MGFAFLPIGLGSLAGGWFGGAMLHHSAKCSTIRASVVRHHRRRRTHNSIAMDLRRMVKPEAAKPALTAAL